MEDRLSRILCDFCYEGTDQDEREVILYGIQLIVETIVKMAILLLFAACIGKFRECVEFYIVFCPLRAMAGGMHCKTNAGCFLSMGLIFVSGLVWDVRTIPDWLVSVFILLCLMVCMKWAPSATENNPITDGHIRRRNKIICVGLLFFWFFETNSSFFHFQKNYIIAAVVSITVLIITQVSTWKKEN